MQKIQKKNTPQKKKHVKTPGYKLIIGIYRGTKLVDKVKLNIPNDDIKISDITKKRSN